MHEILEWETEEDAQEALLQMGTGEINYGHVINIATEPRAREKAFALQLLDSKVQADWKVLTSSLKWQFFGPLRPEQESELKALLRGHPSIGLLTVCSFCRYGYYREEAVSALDKWDDERAIPLLILRSCDWVPKIARKAANSALQKIKSASVEGLSDCLRSLIVQDRILVTKAPKLVSKFQAAVFGREGVLARMREIATPKEQAWLFQHDIRLPGETVQSQTASLLMLKEPSVVLLGLRQLRLQPDEEQLKLLDNLAASKVPEARELAIDLADRHDNLGFLEREIFDSHWRVRGRARLALEKRGVSDFAIRYRERFPDPAAIGGFGEVAANRDLEELLPFVDHADYKVRRAAIRVLGTRRVDSAAAVIQKRLQDEYPPVIAAAVRAMDMMHIPLSIEELEELLNTGNLTPGAFRTKNRALSRLSHWDRLYLVLKLLSERRLAETPSLAIWRWLARSRKVTIAPTLDQWQRAQNGVDKCWDQIEPYLRNALLEELQHWSSRVR